jgi:hypothetical protein
MLARLVADPLCFGWKSAIRANPRSSSAVRGWQAKIMAQRGCKTQHGAQYDGGRWTATSRRSNRSGIPESANPVYLHN